MIGRVHRTWYSVWLDFDKKESEMASIFEAKLIEFDRLFEAFTNDQDKQSIYDNSLAIFLFQKLLHNLRNVARFYKDVCYGDSSTFRTLEKGLAKRERAVYALARKGNLKTRKLVLGLVSFHSIYENLEILGEVRELIKSAS